MITIIELFAIATSVLAFGMALWLYTWVKAQPAGNKKLEDIGAYIQQGANTFLKREYSILSRFAGVIAILILLFIPTPIWKGSMQNIVMAVSFLIGATFSALAGKVGIQVATIANRKAAAASQTGIKFAFLAGFRGGAVMGMAVVGTSLLGVTAVFMITGDATAILGFSFGASSLALFAKAGGGIFTKTADISADLVGKVELGIPEDDPRNPAVIADNVGDNVGDVAGMGADLFDSNVASMAAALVMALYLDGSASTDNVAIVFCYAALGLLASIIGVGTARMGKLGNPNHALSSSTYATTALYVIFTAVATLVLDFSWRIWAAAIIGLGVGTIIGIASDYFTNDEKHPVHHVAKASETGPAFTILGAFPMDF